MPFDLRIQQRNVFPSTACTAAGGPYFSVTHKSTVGKGIRLYITTSLVTLSTAPDSISLCAMPPNGGAAVPIATLSGPTAGGNLTVAGTYVFDFYPGSTTSQVPPGTGSAVTFAGGIVAISIPLQWQIKIALGTGGAATIAIDAEILP
jgi:hypothetical protein